MPRNKSEVRNRLQRAALDLYRDQGFDRTTTAQIAELAGVTERTFFRHFADKREVLFDGEETLRTILTTSIAAAPPSPCPLDTLADAFRSLGPLLEGNRSFSEPRQRIIAATPALQERELAKLAALADSLSAALMDRGIAKGVAALSAKIGMAALVEATDTWFAKESSPFLAHLDAAFKNLRKLSLSFVQPASVGEA